MLPIIPLLPLFDPAPASPAPTAELMCVTCPECDDEPRSDCRTCAGSGSYEVCSGCMQRPWMVAGSEACSCTMPGLHADEPEITPLAECEICNRWVPADDLCDFGVCRDCRDAMSEIVKHEAEEPAVVLHDEVRWALSVGLCSWEQVSA